MISVLYASLCALIIIRLSLNVIRLRRKHRVSLGDGNREDLQRAIRAHGNAVEYIPVGLLLLFGLEYNAAPLWLVHLFGITFLGGRLLHAFAMSGMVMPRRVLGMQLTLFTLLALAVANLFFVPYSKLLLIF